MFSGETDPNNAYLDIQAGSGGTEAQDWAEMLLRMYLRWGEDKGFKTTLVEASAGEALVTPTFVVPYRYIDSGWFDYQPMAPMFVEHIHPNAICYLFCFCMHNRTFLLPSPVRCI